MPVFILVAALQGSTQIFLCRVPGVFLFSVLLLSFGGMLTFVQFVVVFVLF